MITLGEVYDKLLPEYTAERIVVIAGLESLMQWLAQTAKRGYPECEPEHATACKRASGVSEGDTNLDEKKKFWRSQLNQVERACATLIANGGADYDHELVNPSTVIGVLTGASPRRPMFTLPGDNPPLPKVVPVQGVRSMFVWITTHGGHHEVSLGKDTETNKPIPVAPLDGSVCGVCEQVHNTSHEYDHPHSSLRTREWFMLFPHRTQDSELHQCVAHAGRNMNRETPPGEPSPMSCLYWQHLFQVYNAILAQDPGRPMVTLHQFCTSGGHLKFMQHKSYQDHHTVHRWPLFLMATSKEQQFSLGATFTLLFLEALQRALLKGGETRLGEVYEVAREEYWQQHQVEKELNEAASSSSMRFGELENAHGSAVAQLPVRELFTNRGLLQQYERVFFPRGKPLQPSTSGAFGTGFSCEPGTVRDKALEIVDQRVRKMMPFTDLFFENPTGFSQINN